jgi:hypothetical protein
MVLSLMMTSGFLISRIPYSSNELMAEWKSRVETVCLIDERVRSGIQKHSGGHLIPSERKLDAWSGIAYNLGVAQNSEFETMREGMEGVHNRPECDPLRSCYGRLLGSHRPGGLQSASRLKRDWRPSLSS